MGLNPNKGAYLRQYKYISVEQFSGKDNVAPTVNIAGGEAGTVAIGIDSDADAAALSKTAATSRTGITGVQKPANASVGAGNPSFGEISTFGIQALVMTAGDDIRHFMRIPSNWDRKHKIRVRMIFSTQAGDTDASTWKFLYTPYVPGTTVLIAPATALDTVLVSEAGVAVSNTVERTATPGVINGSIIADAALYLAFLCELDATSVGETVHFHGVEFEYTPRYGRKLIQGEARPWAAS